MDQFKNSEADGPLIPREISRGAITLLDELGKGAFGVVYKALLKEDRQASYLTAAKSLHERSTSAQKQELLEEAAVMAQLDNPHVTNLVGVVTVGTPVLMLVEYAEHGSLKGHLEKYDVPQARRLLWAGDVAEGLGHVHSKGFLHRDVAARNVLISSDMRCKVANFGLAREVTEHETYYRSHGGQLPVRWTAPEALESRKFSEKTDMWSFGVLMYEIWTRAALPYKGWSNQKVWVEVGGGYRLPQPDGCPNKIFKLMQQSWSKAPADRPTFAEVTAQLRLLQPGDQQAGVTASGQSLTKMNELPGHAPPTRRCWRSGRRQVHGERQCVRVQ